MDRSSQQLGGILLLLAGVGGIVGNFLHGPQPQTLEALSELGSMWTISHALIGIIGTCVVIGALFLARDVGGSSGEGWALAGTGATLLGGMAVFLIGALETTGFSQLLAGSSGAAADHAFLAVSRVMGSMAAAAGFLFPAAIVAYGLGMLKTQGWPSWLAWVGLGIGVVLLILNSFGISLGAIGGLLNTYAASVWFALVGVIFMGRTSTAAA